MVQKIGRNDPCPCGSGKKYKKCCLQKDAADNTFKHPTSPQTPHKPLKSSVAQPISPPPVAYDVVHLEDDDLDQLSNSVIDLIREGKLDQAEKACDELDRRFPEMPDCLDRRAMLLEARGQNKLAADYYRRAAEHARADGYDSELVDSYLASANKLDPPANTERR
jgi:tetratricopeptide (TPR) repeat protein